jgi:lipopolysaccharide biosynthesis protein
MRMVRKAGAFDADWYRYTYPDVTWPKKRLLRHYFVFGWRENRDPAPDFDTDFYLGQYPDVDTDKWNPLAHYVAIGERERRIASPDRLSNEEPDHDVDFDMPDLTPVIDHRPTAKLAVVMHVFYPELLDEMVQGLSSFDEPVDLFITLTEDQSDHLEEEVRRRFPDAFVFVFPNHGRDIAPFVQLLNTGVFDRYELVCKLHSKRSLHRVDGTKWRQHLIASLIGWPERTAANVELMRADPNIGLLCPANAITGAMHWGSCRQRTVILGWRAEIDVDEMSLAFPAGSMFWFRPFALRMLRAMELKNADFELEKNQLDGTTAHAVERLFGLVCESAGMRLLETADLTSAVRNAHRKAEATPERERKVVAFYLPQFHPIPENDRWWGAGFVEWTNLMRARPMFNGHYQPRIPGELSFYDLRLPETREAQAELAREHGIHGFCYYFYWFGGRKLLDRPLREVLESGRPDFPFCICWANENWTRRWDGREQDVLMAQDYNEHTNRALIHEIIPIMRDPRYITFNGKPVFVVYRITKIPDFPDVVAMWREECRKAGIGEIHLIAVRFDQEILSGAPETYGLDAYADFPPHGARIETIHHRITGLDPKFRGLIYKYDSVIDADLKSYKEGYLYNVHRGLMLAWDNTPRKTIDAHVCHMANPAKFRYWLREAIAQEDHFRPEGESLLFVNAWNEWAEGTYLEPDRRWQRGYLEAVRSATERCRHPNLSEATLERASGAAGDLPTGTGAPGAKIPDPDREDSSRDSSAAAE